jgi:hypothetical protein
MQSTQAGRRTLQAHPVMSRFNVRWSQTIVVSVHDEPVGFDPPAAVDDNWAVTVSVRSFDAFGDIHFHGQNQTEALSR